jgi:hypothetical protein
MSGPEACRRWQPTYERWKKARMATSSRILASGRICCRPSCIALDKEEQEYRKLEPARAKLREDASRSRPVSEKELALRRTYQGFFKKVSSKQ